MTVYLAAHLHGERSEEDAFAVGVGHGDQIILAAWQQRQTRRAIQQRRQRVALKTKKIAKESPKNPKKSPKILKYPKNPLKSQESINIGNKTSKIPLNRL